MSLQRTALFADNECVVAKGVEGVPPCVRCCGSRDVAPAEANGSEAERKSLQATCHATKTSRLRLARSTATLPCAIRWRMGAGVGRGCG